MTYAPGAIGGGGFAGTGTGTNTDSGKVTPQQLQQASRTRTNFPETWVWETLLSGYTISRLAPKY